MSNTSSITSLHELVQSHLSKLSLQETQSVSSINQVPDTKHELAAKVKETGILTPAQLLNSPGRLFPSVIPSNSKSDAVSILAQQVANMYKSKELKRLEEEEEKEEQEKRLLEEKPKLMQTDDYLIDFSSAIIEPLVPQSKYVKENNCHKDSAYEAILIKEEKKTDSVPNVEQIQITDENNRINDNLLWPINHNNLLTTKIKRGKCSPFGRVVCARYISKGLPYMYKNYPSSIVRFNFSTLSPDEIAMKNAKYSEKRVDVCTEFELQKSEMLVEHERLNGYNIQRRFYIY